MFEYLTGLISYVSPEYIVVDVAGVGYKVLVANPYRYHENESTKVFIEQIVRDNNQSLFGFYDLDEKKLFLQLTSVSGIGPKSALAILADDDHSGLVAAISNDNVKFLTKFPGIGKKTAQQIVLDLKDKIKSSVVDASEDMFKVETINKGMTNPILKDGLEALLALGYSEKEVSRIKPKLAQLESNDAGEYVRMGLKLL